MAKPRQCLAALLRCLSRLATSFQSTPLWILFCLFCDNVLPSMSLANSQLLRKASAARSCSALRVSATSLLNVKSHVYEITRALFQVILQPFTKATHTPKNNFDLTTYPKSKAHLRLASTHTASLCLGGIPESKRTRSKDTPDVTDDVVFTR